MSLGDSLGFEFTAPIGEKGWGVGIRDGDKSYTVIDEDGFNNPLDPIIDILFPSDDPEDLDWLDNCRWGCMTYRDSQYDEWATCHDPDDCANDSTPLTRGCKIKGDSEYDRWAEIEDNSLCSGHPPLTPTPTPTPTLTPTPTPTFILPPVPEFDVIWTEGDCNVMLLPAPPTHGRSNTFTAPQPPPGSNWYYKWEVVGGSSPHRIYSPGDWTEEGFGLSEWNIGFESYTGPYNVYCTIISYPLNVVSRDDRFWADRDNPDQQTGDIPGIGGVFNKPCPEPTPTPPYYNIPAGAGNIDDPFGFVTW
jgi:hypothetical protein